MKLPFKKKLGRTVLVLMAGFLLLFIFRFMYGYTTGLSEVREEYLSDFFSEREDLRHNYASDSYKFLKSQAPSAGAETGGGAGASAPHEFNVDQKYEKTATIKSRSTRFEEDEKKLRTKVKSYNAIIQYE